MFWRASLLLSSILVIVMAVEVSRHKRFESGVVTSAEIQGYLIKCEGIDFRNRVTVVSVRLIDSNPSPQFKAFRESLTSQNSAAYLDVPASFERRAHKLAFSRYEGRPDVLYHPKRDNDIHEATLNVDFEPLPRARARTLDLDEAYLKFPGFLPFVVVRTNPVSQAQGFLSDVRRAIVKTVDLRTASAMLWGGAFVFMMAGAFIVKDRKLLMFRSRLRRELLPASSGPRLPHGKDRLNMAEGFVVPPEWDRESIAVQIRSLQKRPAVLSVFTRALVDRFVTGQDERTSKARINFLRAKLEELKIAKEIQSELDDLLFRQVDLDIRRLTREAERGDAKHRLNTQQELRDAEHTRDLLRIKAEASGFEKQIRDIEKSAGGGTGTRERIQKLREQRARARRTIEDPDELKRTENMYDDKIAELEDELRKTL